MAIIKNGILGGFSGKVGTVVGACWKGIDYIRSLATSVVNPKTPAQLEQRARFSLIIAFLRPLTAFLRAGFKSAALHMSALIAAMAYNMKNAIKGIYPAFEIDYTKVLLSQGSLAEALNPTAVSTVAHQIDVTWDDNSEAAEAMPDDQAFFVVYNPATQKAVSVIGGATRQTGADSIQLPEVFSGQQVQCFIGFTNVAESEFSNSQWIASVLVL